MQLCFCENKLTATHKCIVSFFTPQNGFTVSFTLKFPHNGNIITVNCNNRAHLGAIVSYLLDSWPHAGCPARFLNKRAPVSASFTFFCAIVLENTTDWLSFTILFSLHYSDTRAHRVNAFQFHKVNVVLWRDNTGSAKLCLR